MIGKIIIFIDLDFLKLRDNPKDYHYQYQFKKIIEKYFQITIICCFLPGAIILIEQFNNITPVR